MSRTWELVILYLLTDRNQGGQRPPDLLELHHLGRVQAARTLDSCAARARCSHLAGDSLLVGVVGLEEPFELLRGGLDLSPEVGTLRSRGACAAGAGQDRCVSVARGDILDAQVGRQRLADVAMFDATVALPLGQGTEVPVLTAVSCGVSVAPPMRRPYTYLCPLRRHTCNR